MLAAMIRKRIYENFIRSGRHSYSSFKDFSDRRTKLAAKTIWNRKIRKGTIELFKELKLREHIIYIYTTSFRPSLKMLLTFHLYGIPVDRFINQGHHDKELKENRNRTSKYPPAFGIDIHVDDLPGVRIEGERHNFRTIIIDPRDNNWIQTVIGHLVE